MKNYYVSLRTLANGDNEVHTDGCPFFPRPEKHIDLGLHPNCENAMTAARAHYPQVNGCVYCCTACYTQ
jgi:hypothetical protein